MIPLLRGHDPSVKLADLVILASLALVGPVALAGDDVAGSLVRRFSHRVTRKAWCAGRRVGRVVAIGELRVQQEPSRKPT